MLLTFTFSLFLFLNQRTDQILGYSEGEGEEAGAQQIPQCSQVGDGVIIRVQTMPPDQPHQRICHVQQYQYLQQEGMRKRRAVCYKPLVFIWL